MNKHDFTFFEMLIVAVVMALIAAVTLPRLSRIPSRLQIESALTSIREAFTETAMRARTTGTPIKLVLDIDNDCFLVEQANNSKLTAQKDWVPPLRKSEDAEQSSLLALESKNNYKLPSYIEWHPEDTDLNYDDEISFSFYEDGQAAGLPIRFYMAGHYYQMDVDRLTGDSLIMEIED